MTREAGCKVRCALSPVKPGNCDRVEKPSSRIWPISSSFRPSVPGSTRFPKRSAVGWRPCAINRSAGRSQRYTAHRKKTGPWRRWPKRSVCRARVSRRGSPTWSVNPPSAISPGGGCSSRASSFRNHRIHSRCSPIVSAINPKRRSRGHSSGSLACRQGVFVTPIIN